MRIHTYTMYASTHHIDLKPNLDFNKEICAIARTLVFAQVQMLQLEIKYSERDKDTHGFIFLLRD